METGVNEGNSPSDKGWGDLSILTIRGTIGLGLGTVLLVHLSAAAAEKEGAGDPHPKASGHGRGHYPTSRRRGLTPSSRIGGSQDLHLHPPTSE